MRGTILGVQIIRTIAFWGLYWGLLSLGIPIYPLGALSEKLRFRNMPRVLLPRHLRRGGAAPWRCGLVFRVRGFRVLGFGF